MDLFGGDTSDPRTRDDAPLAERVRPRILADFVGQDHLLGEGKPLRILIERDQVPSMILWGPPGSGKTTLARLIAQHTHAQFVQLSAVSAGVKDVRAVIDRAATQRQRRRTILFIDEIHRFNKAQQDALLHSVEEGLVTLIGATTENPSFEVISPLLSRCRVYVLQALGADHLRAILDHALTADAQLTAQSITVNDRDRLVLLSGGDARMLLNGLETAIRIAGNDGNGPVTIGRREFDEAFQRKLHRYDNGGEEHYNVISAFIKSVRGSDPDAAVYWMARMLDGGEDPKFIARRLIILASEDVGNADPYGITLAVSTFTAVDYVGMPEARIILAQCATYLASAPKSNAAYVAISEALEDAEQGPDAPVPLHLRNAPTGLLKELGYGDNYKYAHDFDGHIVDQQYLPDALKEKLYYRPGDNGREKDMKERLNRWWPKRRR
ncbi:MAG TPA: replication-associated recombination protein A [Bacteroidota bacterium]|nr:replication-associated recombination protein A [Bacteroidota bacterium]